MFLYFVLPRMWRGNTHMWQSVTVNGWKMMMTVLIWPQPPNHLYKGVDFVFVLLFGCRLRFTFNYDLRE